MNNTVLDSRINQKALNSKQSEIGEKKNKNNKIINISNELLF